MGAKEGNNPKANRAAAKATPEAAGTRVAKEAKAEVTKTVKLATVPKSAAPTGEAPVQKVGRMWATVVKKVQQGMQKVRRPSGVKTPPSPPQQ